MSERKTETEAVAELARNEAASETVECVRGDTDTTSILLVPDGGGKMRVESVKKYLDENRRFPERRGGVAVMQTVNGFIDHVKRFADDDTAVFADASDRAKPKLIAVLDYHRRTAEGQPRNMGHRTRYDFPVSDEWTEWDAADGCEKNQSEFAAFIEERIADVAPPDAPSPSMLAFLATVGCQLAGPARLMELSRGLTVSVDHVVANHVRLESGAGEISFKTTHNDAQGAPLKIPGAFLIAIPIFRGGPLYQICVRLRYTVKQSQVRWSLAMYRADRSFDHAFDEAIGRVQSETSLPVFRGLPET